MPDQLEDTGQDVGLNDLQHLIVCGAGQKHQPSGFRLEVYSIQGAILQRAKEAAASIQRNISRCGIPPNFNLNILLPADSPCLGSHTDANP